MKIRILIGDEQGPLKGKAADMITRAVLDALKKPLAEGEPPRGTGDKISQRVYEKRSDKSR